MSKTADYKATREVKTFVDLNRCAGALLKTAKEVRAGSDYTTMASNLMTAFTAKLDSTIRYLGIEVEDALELAEQTEV